MKLPGSHDSEAVANGITWPKVMLHLIKSSWPKEGSGDIYKAIGITWPKKSGCTSFLSSLPNEFGCAIYDPINITCCWFLMPIVSIIKTLMLHLILIILALEI